MVNGAVTGKSMLTAVVFAILAASPASELRAALSDLQNVPPADRPYVRYISGYNESKLDKLGRVISFWANSLSNSRRVTVVRQVGETLWRVDIRDYQWPKDAWEKLQKLEPYFRYPWTGHPETLQLYNETGSSGAIFRADWFLFHTSIEPFYSKFLGLPGTLAEVKAKYRVDEDGARALSLPQGGSVLRSIVAIHNRRLERLPTLTGYWWQSYDFDANAGQKNLVENLLEVQADAGEFIWSLPNGLQAYYLANGQGVQQAEAPAEIAQDSRTPFRQKTVVNARGCVGCHDGGINPFADVVSGMLDGGNLDVRSYDYNRAAAVQDFYRGQLVQQQIASDNAAFAASVLQACGVTPEQVSAEFVEFVYGYSERLVTAEIAAVELGCTVEEFVDAAQQTYAGTLLAIASGQSVARDAWEAAYPVAAVKVKGGGK